MHIRFARSATRHRVSRERSRYVIEHCGLRYRVPAPPGSLQPDDRLAYLGDDAVGTPLEVMLVELTSGEQLVIHAMPLRERYRHQYEEAKKWRT